MEIPIKAGKFPFLSNYDQIQLYDYRTQLTNARKIRGCFPCNDANNSVPTYVSREFLSSFGIVFCIFGHASVNHRFV